jgi:hypothetical protein
LSSEFGVHGSYFAQQNGTTWCCAHASLLVILNNLSASLGEVCTWNHRKINELLSIDHQKETANGLSSDKIMKVLEEAGLPSNPINYLGLSKEHPNETESSLSDRVISSK